MSHKSKKYKCNNDISNSSDYSKFIFFGCWNNINCNSEYIYRDIVLDYINSNETDIKQIYIAGDNWYTNKKKIDEKEYKLYITDILRTGYDKLYRMNKEIYIAVGNHDVDRDNKAKNVYEEELKRDCNINTQKYYLEKIKHDVNKTIDVPTLEYLKMIQDTQLNEDKLCEKGVYIYVDNIGVRYNKDNIIIIINTNIFDNFEKGKKYLEEIKLVIKEVIKAQAIKSCKEQIFVMGHIPLFTYKKDKISINDINKEDISFRILIIELFDIFVNYNIIYLCADTHNFSIMEIKHNNKTLIQITAGTGGADPDLIKNENVTEPKNIEIKIEIGQTQENIFEIKAYALNPYGYVSIDINNKNIDVCYTQVIKEKQKKYNKSKSIMKPRPLSAPDKIIDNKIIKQGNLYNSLSLSTSNKITKLNRINKLYYRIYITKDNATVNYITKNSLNINAFASNFKYQTRNICNNIKSNKDNSIKSENKDIYCYIKEIKDKKKLDKKKGTI
jgi:hypothetical protein